MTLGLNPILLTRSSELKPMIAWARLRPQGSLWMSDGGTTNLQIGETLSAGYGGAPRFCLSEW